MTTALIGLQGQSSPANTSSTWNDIKVESTVYNLVDNLGAATSWTWQYAGPPAGVSAFGEASVGSGDAAWVDESVISQVGHYESGSSEAIAQIGVPAGSYDIEVFWSQPSGRVTAISVNGGAYFLTPSAAENSTATHVFSGVSPVDGVITLRYKVDASSSGDAYLNAVRITEADPIASLALDQTTLTPGSTISGTTSNFTEAPTSVSLSDGASPALTPTPTITANGDDWDFSADIPDFAAQAKAAGEGNPIQGLIPGPINVTVE